MAEENSKNPLRAVLAVKREELPLALSMFGYFFLVITAFWILKPLKKSALVKFYSDEAPFDLFGMALSGSQAEQVAKVLNMVVAYGAVVVFSAVSKKLVRQKLTFAFSAFFIACFAAFAGVANAKSEAVVWSFYLFGDLYNTVMVATFFAFLNDSVKPEAARRVYGLVVLGGVVGGVFGTGTVRALIKDKGMGTTEWMLVCIGISVVIVALAFYAGKLVDRAKAEEQTQGSPQVEDDGGNPAIAGAKLVLRSRYLLAVVAMVGLYEIVSTVMDFQFTATLEHYAKLGEIDFDQRMSTTFLITNITSMVVQILLTGFIMTRFRLTVAVLILPVAALSASSLFLVLPIAWFGSMLNTSDNALNYSINQSAKEALYTPTSRDEKYKAKAFIDMFVQRFAKALAVGVSLGITLWFTSFDSIRYLSLFTVVIIALWILAARYAGNRFHELTDGPDAEDGTPSKS